MRNTGGYRFRRQVPIGRYIADFACIEAKLVVEVDGAPHMDSENDAVRDGELARKGFRVLRFWNNQVLREIQDVLEEILKALGTRSDTPHTSRARE